MCGVCVCVCVCVPHTLHSTRSQRESRVSAGGQVEREPRHPPRERREILHLLRETDNRLRAAVRQQVTSPLIPQRPDTLHLLRERDNRLRALQSQMTDDRLRALRSRERQQVTNPSSLGWRVSHRGGRHERAHRLRRIDERGARQRGQPWDEAVHPCFRFHGSGCRVQVSGFGVQGLGLGCGVQGVEFRV